MRSHRLLPLAASLALVGCATVDTTTRPAEIAGLRAEADISGFDIVVEAAGCEDTLEVTVDRIGDVFVADATIEWPANEFGYCYRYIDTGGGGPADAVEGTLHVQADPGEYRIMAAGEVVTVVVPPGLAR